MPKDLSYMIDAETNVDRLSKLPHAPLAMPRQVLEHPQGLFARLLPICGGWLRTTVFGN